MKYVVIGDVHGCYKTLCALLAALPKDATPVFVGDLIDRGPDDAKVVQLVMDNGWQSVMGNHEHMMKWHGKEGGCYFSNTWTRNGGKGLDAFTADQIAWMSALPLYLDFPESKRADGLSLFVSHAPVRSRLEAATNPHTFSNPRTIDDSILWYRGVPPAMDGKFQVYGHTPESTAQVLPHAANVDTGAVYGYSRHEQGRKLTALIWPTMEIIAVPTQDFPPT